VSKIGVAYPTSSLEAWHNNKTGAPVTRSLIAYDH
jgi:hypothetical protein